MSEDVRTGKRSVFCLGGRICEVALVIVVLGCVPAFAGPVPPCGDAAAPQCAGTCPDGQRCIATSDFLLVVNAFATCGPTEPLRREAAAQNGDSSAPSCRAAGFRWHRTRDAATAVRSRSALRGAVTES
jgi:hypothetical protein